MNIFVHEEVTLKDRKEQSREDAERYHNEIYHSHNQSIVLHRVFMMLTMESVLVTIAPSKTFK